MIKRLLYLALSLCCLSAATITVNSAADPASFNPSINISQLGAIITLRDAVNAANNTPGDDIITFHPSLAGQTITLQQLGQGNTALGVASNITINGPATGVTISRANKNMRHFYVNAGYQLTLINLTLRDGLVADDGGAIFNLGQLTTNNVVFTANRANNPSPTFSGDTNLPGRGGAVCNTGSGVFVATLTRFGIDNGGNIAENVGGAVFSNSTALRPSRSPTQV